MSRLSDFFASLFRRKPIPPGPIEEAALIKTRIGAGEISPVVFLIQEALLAAGHQLAADGEYGTITAQAVKAFQAARLIDPTGVVDVVTARALDAVTVAPATRSNPSGGSVLKAAPWLSEIRAVTGVKEVPGAANSPIIMAWRGDIAKAFPEMANYAAQYTGDEIPWCGFGLGAAMARRGIRPPFGPTDKKRFMWANSWGDDWGIKLTRPTKADHIVGSIMTYTRAGGGHVALLEGMASDDVAIIRGCNQSDMVNVARKSMDQFTVATWPVGVPLVRGIVGVTTDSVASGKEM